MKLLSPLRLCLFALIATAMSLFFISFSNENISKTTDLEKKSVMDESMVNVKVKQFHNGVLTQTLTLKTWRRMKNENQVHFEMPLLTTFQNETNWKICALEGQGYLQHPHGPLQRLELHKNVSIQSVDKKMKQDWQLLTEFLTYNPTNKRASTNHEVEIKGTGISMKAQGLSADLTGKTIQFLDGVKANYATQKI